jgi:DNA-binding response OmpR family regulator
MRVRLSERLEHPGAHHPAQNPAPEPLVEQGTAGANILVVDDDPALRWMITAYLQTEGYRVQTASNGARALECIEQEPPKLILLDMNMPVLNGEDFVGELRARDLNIPIVIMTAAKDARQAAEQLEAAAYVVKPVNLPLLLGRIDELCA